MSCVAALALVGPGVGCLGPAAAAGKASKPALPLSARPAPTAGLSSEEINRAAKLCVNKCVRCHQLYDPAPYSDSAWRMWMTKMASKSHLKPEETDLLSRYFEAFRAQ